MCGVCCYGPIPHCPEQIWRINIKISFECVCVNAWGEGRG